MRTALVLLETMAVAVGWGVFLVVWTARRFIVNRSLVALGIGFLFVGGWQLLHALVLAGVGILPGAACGDLATQMRLAGGLVLAVVLLAFTLVPSHRASLVAAWGAAGVLSTALAAVILVFPVSPVCFVEGRGPTAFKTAFDGGLGAAFVAAFLLLRRRAGDLPVAVARPLGAGLLLSAAASAVHALGPRGTGWGAMAGPVAQGAGFAFFYLALIRSGLTLPLDTFFRRWKVQSDELKQAEDRHRLLFETLDQGVVFQNASGAITAANPAALRILGLSEDEILGRTSSDPRWRTVRADGSDFPGSEHPSMVALRTGRPARDVLLGVHPPGEAEPRWIQVNAMPQFAPGWTEPVGAYTTFTDVTAQRKSEDRLREALLFLKGTERIGRIGGWKANPRSDALTWTDGVRAIVEVAPGVRMGLDAGLRFFAPEYIGPLREALGRTFEGGVPFDLEAEVLTAGGRRVWVEVRGLRKIEEGREPSVVGTIQEIGERKRAEAERRRQEDLVGKVFDSTDAHLAVVGPDGHILRVNAAWRDFAAANGAGGSLTLDVGASYFTPVVDEARGAAAARAAYEGVRAVQQGTLPYFETLYECGRPGLERWFRMRVVPLVGRPGTVIVAHEDITAQKQAEQAQRLLNEDLERKVAMRTAELRHEVEVRRAAEAALKEAQALGHLGHWTQDVESGRVDWSDELWRILDLDRAATVPSFDAALERIHPGDRPGVVEAWERALAGGAPMDVVHRILPRDGRVRTVRVRVQPESAMPGGRPRMIGTMQDITEAVQAEERLRESHRRLETILNSTESFAYVCDMETHEVLFANDVVRGFLGDVVGRRCWESIQAGQTGPCPFCTNSRLLAADGSPGGLVVWEHHNEKLDRWFECRDRAIRWTDGRIVRLEIAIDITERKRIERELRESREELERRVEQRTAELMAGRAQIASQNDRNEAIIRTTQDGFVVLDASGRPVEVNENYCRMTGFTREELLKMSIAAVVDEESPGRIAERLDVIRADGWARFLTRHRTKDGRTLEIEATATVIRASGEVVFFLRDMTGRRQMEAQLLQAQKMEAIGQLAGGVAHDFNNILLAMFLQLDLLMEDTPRTGPVAEALSDLRANATRASNLTRQLLMFSRRQPMEKRPVDLNAVVGGLVRMIARVVGEHITFRFTPQANLPAVSADPGMIEQVLVNLCINARDAMPDGGALDIFSHLVEIGEGDVVRNPAARAGRHVGLAVTDTGCGMDETVLAHIFEPFFTTKGIGKGTGLGLPTVHGIIQEHNGWIEVASEPGKGSTFRVMIPAIAGGGPTAVEAPPAAGPGGSETILLVEDDEAARQMSARGLKRRGYRVVEAGSGPEAVEAWNQVSGGVDLLLTDMVMPGGLSGLDLAARLRGLKPGLKVILASGYSEEFLKRSGSLPPGIAKLQKPYALADLARLLRAQLDGPPPAPGPG